jgi:DNA-binding transcriptional regulator LsrR (DeoR family)
MKDLTQMSKQELLEYANSLQKKSSGNKEATLKILRESESWLTLDQIADQLQISKNNVSSQLTPIRKSGHIIIETNLNGIKHLKLIDSEVAKSLNL